LKRLAFGIRGSNVQNLSSGSSLMDWASWSSRRAWYLFLDHWVENDGSAENGRTRLALLLFWLVLLALLFPNLVLCENA
jgi:hypothetical protein